MAKYRTHTAEFKAQVVLEMLRPGGIPLTLDAKCPRYMGSGKWRYRNMIGYTSVGAGTSIVNVRLNCLPEVTLHRLHAGD